MTDVAATRGATIGGLGADYFPRLVNQLPILVWSTDRDLHITSRHGGLLATFGLEAGAGDGQHVALNIDPDGRAAVIAAHQAALAGESASYETSFRGRTFSAHVDPQLGPGGATVGVVGFAFEVTERRRAEAALRESEERFAMAFRANPAPLAITTLGEGKVLDVNDAFLRLLDRPREEVIGETTIALGVIDGDRRAALTRLLREGGTVGDIELSVRRRSGSTRDVVLSLVRMELRGEACTLGIYRDVTEGKRADEQLRASRAALRGLATRQQDVREDERARIAREIHDSLGQALTALKLDLAAAREAAQHGAPGLVERLGETAQMVDDLVKGVRRIATELRPPILDELGLPAAVEWLARDFTRRSGLACSVNVHPSAKPIAADLATALFRILQEALTNISRHAAARRVDIELSVKSDVVTLEISDDGRGITEAGASGPGSLGILGMRERAAALGGTLEAEPSPSGGFRVEARLPAR
jgi:two-component system sensor histidine kinase UhpB